MSYSGCNSCLHMTSISWQSPAPWLQADAFFNRGSQSKRYLPALPEPPLPALPLERATARPTRGMCRRTGLSAASLAPIARPAPAASPLWDLLTPQTIPVAMREQHSIPMDVGDTGQQPQLSSWSWSRSGVSRSFAAKWRLNRPTAPALHKPSHWRTTRCFMDAKPHNWDHESKMKESATQKLAQEFGASPGILQTPDNVKWLDGAARGSWEILCKTQVRTPDQHRGQESPAPG